MDFRFTDHFKSRIFDRHYKKQFKQKIMRARVLPKNHAFVRKMMNNKQNEFDTFYHVFDETEKLVYVLKKESGQIHVITCYRPTEKFFQYFDRSARRNLPAFSAIR